LCDLFLIECRSEYVLQTLGGRPIILAAEIGMPASVPSLRMVLRFILGRRQVAERFEQPPRVEPIDPGERREFHGLEVAPGAPPLNQLRLEEADHRFGQRVVVTVADAADGGLDPGLRACL